MSQNSVQEVSACSRLGVCKYRSTSTAVAIRQFCVVVFVFCFYSNLLIDDDSSHYMQPTGLWVILTVTEGGRGVDLQCTSQTLSWWWMEQPSPCCRLHSAATVNDKLHTCLSLFNEHQVCVMFCVCVCMQEVGRENWVKLFVIIWVPHLIVTTHVSTTTHCAPSSRHTHTHAHIHLHTYQPAMHWSNAALSCFIALSLSLVLPPSVTQVRDPSCHGRPYE